MTCGGIEITAEYGNGSALVAEFGCDRKPNYAAPNHQYICLPHRLLLTTLK